MQRSGDVTVQCSRYSGRFVINNTVSASIEGLHFFGCGGNTVNRVKKFTVQDTTFDGIMEGNGSALIINKVTCAKIVSSSFLHNAPGPEFTETLHATFSNVDIISCKFMHNQEVCCLVKTFDYTSMEASFATTMMVCCSHWNQQPILLTVISIIIQHTVLLE